MSETLNQLIENLKTCATEPERLLRTIQAEHAAEVEALQRRLDDRPDPQYEVAGDPTAFAWMRQCRAAEKRLAELEKAQAVKPLDAEAVLREMSQCGWSLNQALRTDLTKVLASYSAPAADHADRAQLENALQKLAEAEAKLGAAANGVMPKEAMAAFSAMTFVEKKAGDYNTLRRYLEAQEEKP